MENHLNHSVEEDYKTLRETLAQTNEELIKLKKSTRNQESSEEATDVLGKLALRIEKVLGNTSEEGIPCERGEKDCKYHKDRLKVC